jgi:hypothetical protein
MLPLPVKRSAIHQAGAPASVASKGHDRGQAHVRVRGEPDGPVRTETAIAAIRRSPAIRSCVGYLVDSPHGRIGTVVGLRYQRRDRTQPAALVVGAGQNGAHLLMIPLSQLTSIRPSERRVVLRASPRISAAPPDAEAGRRPMRRGQ